MPSANILGIEISRLDLGATMSLLSHWIEEGQKKRLCVTSVNCILWARKNPRLREVYNTADLCLADGVPLVWSSYLLGKRISGRVTGLDLLPEFSRIAEQNGYSFFLLGASEGVAHQLGIELQRRYPKLKIVGIYCPPFADTFSEVENAHIVELVNSANPDVLWVSLGAPKQDFWIHENFNRISVKVAIGVGGAFEVCAGLIPRAPRWMQILGLEWFHRFVMEPTRLFRRYFIEAPVFVPLVLLQRLGWLK